MICRTSLAGAIGYLVHRATGIKYIVESYEPHALYMLESKVWKKWDPRYWLERAFQALQNKTATFLLPVSSHYASFLEEQGVSKSKIMVVPCVVDHNLFVRKHTQEGRNALNISQDATVGIYVGKFDGLYYDREAFEIFALARKIFPKFKMIVLTPHPSEEITLKMTRAGFDEDEYIVKNVPYRDVPRYLSMSDFAFATYKPSPSKRFLSPIKVGEYWSCGLPVMLTKGVGDDADIIHASGCGSIFSFEDKDGAAGLHQIAMQLSDSNVREKQFALARQYRNVMLLEKAYHRIIHEFIG
ncbi:glycosyltransferase family protein [Pseudochryseolinea flava]|nr:hypothetical protein [Pseudochryseolinea flava]